MREREKGGQKSESETEIMNKVTTGRDGTKEKKKRQGQRRQNNLAKIMMGA